MGEIGQRPPSSAAGRDVVYIFTAPEAGKYSVKVNNYINKDPYDLVIYVATDVPTGPPPVPDSPRDPNAQLRAMRIFRLTLSGPTA